MAAQLAGTTRLTAPFLEAWSATKREEGGYANNPHDSGGETNYGITIAVARADGYLGEMRDLPLDRAREIAKRRYWDIMKLDSIAILAPEIARKMFDAGFLCGIGRVGTWFQESLNVFNQSHKKDRPPRYPELVVDGVIGPGTIYSFREYILWRKDDGIIAMLNALRSRQGAYLLEIASQEPDDKDEEFIFAWMLNRV